MSDALPYPGVTRNARLRGVKNSLNKYFAMYTCPTRFRIRVKRASPAK